MALAVAGAPFSDRDWSVVANRHLGCAVLSADISGPAKGSRPAEVTPCGVPASGSFEGTDAGSKIERPLQNLTCPLL
jgi:hypothetical protein